MESPTVTTEFKPSVPPSPTREDFLQSLRKIQDSIRLWRSGKVTHEATVETIDNLIRESKV